MSVAAVPLAAQSGTVGGGGEIRVLLREQVSAARCPAPGLLGFGTADLSALRARSGSECPRGLGG